MTSCICCVTSAVESEEDETVRPDCYKHFTPRFKTSTLDQVVNVWVSPLVKDH